MKRKILLGFFRCVIVLTLLAIIVLVIWYGNYRKELIKRNAGSISKSTERLLTPAEIEQNYSKETEDVNVGTEKTQITSDYMSGHWLSTEKSSNVNEDTVTMIDSVSGIELSEFDAQTVASNPPCVATLMQYVFSIADKENIESSDVQIQLINGTREGVARIEVNFGEDKYNFYSAILDTNKEIGRASCRERV